MPIIAVGEPWWDDRPLFVVGGGPSLRGYDLSRLRERGRVLGINDSAFLVPSDAAFSIDRTWLQRREARILAFPGEVWVGLGEPETENLRLPAKVNYLRRVQGSGLSTDPREVVNGLNSGYSALNLAVHKRARTIYLLGYDLTPTPAGDTHWHGGYPWNHGTAIKYYERWARRFDAVPACLPAGTVVYNANPRSAVTAFPFTTYEELGLCRAT